MFHPHCGFQLQAVRLQCLASVVCRCSPAVQTQAEGVALIQWCQFSSPQIFACNADNKQLVLRLNWHQGSLLQSLYGSVRASEGAEYYNLFDVQKQYSS